LAVTTESLVWTKITPTGTIPTNITEGVLIYDYGIVYLLMGHREIWPPEPSDGSGANITFSNTVYAYDISLNSWSIISVSGGVPLARAYPAGAYSHHERRIYFYGGSTFNNAYGDITLFDDFWYYDIQSNQFHEISQAGSITWPDPLTGATLFHVDGHLYLFGGINDVEFGLPFYTNKLWSYNIITGIWNLISTSSAPSAREVPQQFQILGQLYINGGESFNLDTFQFEIPNDTWRFNTFDGNWYNTGPQGILTPAREYSASFSFGLQWALYGGEAVGTQQEGCGALFPQNPVNEFWIYYPILNYWQQKHPIGTAPPALKRIMSVEVDLYDAYIFSGFDFTCPGPGQVYNNDIYKITLT